MEPCERFRLKTNVVLREEEDGGILYNADTGAFTFTNLMSLRLLQGFDGKIQEKEMVRILSEKYKDIPLEKLQEDVRKFIEALGDFKEPIIPDEQGGKS
jgi:hypothetical protein